MSESKAEESIIQARVGLLLEQPFFGTLATRLLIKESSETVDYMGTNGITLFYNNEFVLSLNKKESMFMFSHNVMHCVYEHLFRGSNKSNTRAWDEATDHVVNLELMDLGVGTVPAVFKDKLCADRRFVGMNAEEVYNILCDEGVGSTDNNGEMITSGDLIDDHIDASTGRNSNGDSVADGLSDGEISELKAATQQAMMQAAKSAGNSKTPSSVRGMIDELLNPKVDWREMLECTIKSAIKSDYTFSTPSRKSQSSGCYLPGMDNDTSVSVCVAIDTSGSISERMLKEFLAEVKGIMDEFQDYELLLFCFDTSIHNPQMFTHSNGNDIITYCPAGFGGTDFEIIFDFLKDVEAGDKTVGEGGYGNSLSNGVQRLIILTDGYPCYGSKYPETNGWGDPNFTDTIFVIHGSTTIESPYGITTYIDH